MLCKIRQARGRNALGVLVATLAAWGVIESPMARAVTLDWVRQFGGASYDHAEGVSADRLGSVYVTGYSYVNNTVETEAFLRKYDAAGSLQWSRQFGTNRYDYGASVSADGLGSIYVTGRTEGNLGGTNPDPSGLGNDLFVTKYDDSGVMLWARQLGTSNNDFGQAVAADGLGSVYVGGGTFGSLGGTNAGGADAFLAKYDATGLVQWTRQFGTASSELINDAAADGLGNIYVTGYTEGSLSGMNAGGADAFVSKFNSSGVLQLTRQLGTSAPDESWGVAADILGNVFISGRTDGSLGGPNAGSRDAFISRYDAAGELKWTQQLGTTGWDYSHDVATDGLGNVFVSGETFGSLEGTSAGSYDAFIAKYSVAGSLLWTRQFGSTSGDFSHSLSADRAGIVYIAGSTNGSLGGSSPNGNDAFVAKFSDPAVPEPAGLMLALLALIAVLVRCGLVELSLRFLRRTASVGVRILFLRRSERWLRLLASPIG